MTVREANLTPASSADREPELIESSGTARLHLTLATTDYDHDAGGMTMAQLYFCKPPPRFFAKY